jgi:hypothetical protein
MHTYGRKDASTEVSKHAVLCFWWRRRAWMICVSNKRVMCALEHSCVCSPTCRSA